MSELNEAALAKLESWFMDVPFQVLHTWQHSGTHLVIVATDKDIACLRLWRHARGAGQPEGWSLSEDGLYRRSDLPKPIGWMLREFAGRE